VGACWSFFAIVNATALAIERERAIAKNDF
jgi:hypothetical protein